MHSGDPWDPSFESCAQLARAQVGRLVLTSMRCRSHMQQIKHRLLLMQLHLVVTRASLQNSSALEFVIDNLAGPSRDVGQLRSQPFHSPDVRNVTSLHTLYFGSKPSLLCGNGASVLDGPRAVPIPCLQASALHNEQ